MTDADAIAEIRKLPRAERLAFYRSLEPGELAHAVHGDAALLAAVARVLGGERAHELLLDAARLVASPTQ